MALTDALIIVLDVVLLSCAMCLAVPCFVLLIECIAAKPSTGPSTPASPIRPSFAVLVPAHDEELGIAQTVAHIKKQLGPGDRLVVVADNCTDNTAALAAEAGAEVVSRNDDSRIGKGYALAHGLAYLSDKSPEAVVVIDADCRVDRGTLEHLAGVSVHTGRPVQADYILSSQRTDPRSTINAFALMLKNRVRPSGLSHLRMPCPLLGSGMAFPWSLLQGGEVSSGDLVEDMVLGVRLGMRGVPPLFCPSVAIGSTLPLGKSAQLGQRRRWEVGHLDTLLRYGPRLLWRGIIQARLSLIAMALDLMVPPLSLLASLLVASAILGAIHGVAGGSTAPLLTAVVAGSALAVGVAVAWHRFGRSIFSLRDLFSVPFYVVWKWPMYFVFLRGRSSRRWVRTERQGDKPGRK